MSNCFAKRPVSPVPAIAFSGGRTASAQPNDWLQHYSYDPYGNGAVTGYIPNPGLTPTSLNQYTNNRGLGTGAHL